MVLTTSYGHSVCLSLSTDCRGRGQVLLVAPGLGTVPHSQQFSKRLTNQSSKVKAFLFLILTLEIQKPKTFNYCILKTNFPGFPGGAVVKNPPANAGGTLEPWSGKIPHAVEQLSPCATTTEPAL